MKIALNLLSNKHWNGFRYLTNKVLRQAFIIILVAAVTNLIYINSILAQEIKITDEQAQFLAYDGTPDDLKKLLETGYDVNRIYNCTPLLIPAIRSAVKRAYDEGESYTLEKVKLLIEAGADVNAYPCPDWRSSRPLFVAATLPRDMMATGDVLFEAIEKQISGGGEYCDFPGLISKPCKDISEQEKKQIRESIDKSIEASIRRSKDDFINIMEILINNGADVNSVDGKNRTVLHATLINNPYLSADFIKYLVEKGANVNAQDALRYTPLFLAYGTKNKNAVDMLIKLGADTNIRGYDGLTYNEVDRSRMVQELFDNNGKMIE